MIAAMGVRDDVAFLPSSFPRACVASPHCMRVHVCGPISRRHCEEEADQEASHYPATVQRRPGVSRGAGGGEGVRSVQNMPRIQVKGGGKVESHYLCSNTKHHRVSERAI